MKLTTAFKLLTAYAILLLIYNPAPRVLSLDQTGIFREEMRANQKAELRVLLNDQDVYWYAGYDFGVEEVWSKGTIINPQGCAYTYYDDGLIVETWAKVAENRYLLMSRNNQGMNMVFVTGECE